MSFGPHHPLLRLHHLLHSSSLYLELLVPFQPLSLLSASSYFPQRTQLSKHFPKEAPSPGHRSNAPVQMIRFIPTLGRLSCVEARIFLEGICKEGLFRSQLKFTTSKWYQSNLVISSFLERLICRRRKGSIYDLLPRTFLWRRKRTSGWVNNSFGCFHG